MPELRKDPVIGRWVIISTERAKRPKDFEVAPEKELSKDSCPFCEGSESQTPPEIFALRKSKTKKDSPGWDVRVVPSISPVLRMEEDLNRRANGMYDMMNGVGAHEVVIETSQHIANIADLDTEQISKVVDTYLTRMRELEKDVRFKYVLMFKNYGRSAGGGRIRHARSQLIATPVTPKRLKEELLGAKWYFDYKERCIFCDIIEQERRAPKRIVQEIDGFIILTPFASRFPFETWILPRKHSCDFSSIDEFEVKDLSKALKVVLSKQKKALNDPPYNYILHTAPFRRQRRDRAGYWRTIEKDFHWHIEIIPRLTRIAGFEWGTGFYINPVPPEEAARYLKETVV